MAEQSFEKALEELEGIVAKLEQGGLSLDESLGLFEKGVKLSRYLRKELDRAEKKIEILLKDTSGELKAVPFEGEGGGENPGGANTTGPENKESGEGADEDGGGTLPFE